MHRSRPSQPPPPGAEPWKTFSLIATATATAAAAALVAFAAPAAAQEATCVYPQTLVVAKTRAELKVELAASRADGLLVASEARHSVGDGRGAPRHLPAAAMISRARLMAQGRHVDPACACRAEHFQLRTAVPRRRGHLRRRCHRRTGHPRQLIDADPGRCRP